MRKRNFRHLLASVFFALLIAVACMVMCGNCTTTQYAVKTVEMCESIDAYGIVKDIRWSHYNKQKNVPAGKSRYTTILYVVTVEDSHPEIIKLCGDHKRIQKGEKVWLDCKIKDDFIRSMNNPSECHLISEGYRYPIQK